MGGAPELAVYCLNKLLQWKENVGKTIYFVIGGAVQDYHSLITS